MSLLHETTLSGKIQGTLLTSERPGGLGVIVAAGSSGRVDVDRARLFASQGAVALALRWFGGNDQPPGICEVPLETFTAAVDELVQSGCNRLAFVGTSKGAEAGLLTAAYDFFELMSWWRSAQHRWSGATLARDGMAKFGRNDLPGRTKVSRCPLSPMTHIGSGNTLKAWSPIEAFMNKACCALHPRWRRRQSRSKSPGLGSC